MRALLKLNVNRPGAYWYVCMTSLSVNDLARPPSPANAVPFPLPSYKLKNLEPETDYIIHVHASTGAGMGGYAFIEGRTLALTRESPPIARLSSACVLLNRHAEFASTQLYRFESYTACIHMYMYRLRMSSHCGSL